jgi:hypothetical protein
MGTTQSISLHETYELALTPSLFKYDDEAGEDTTIDVSEEHTDKIATYISSKEFKHDIELITDVSIRPSRENASTVQLKFKPSSFKYSSSDCMVLVTGKWGSTLKQRKPSVKKSAAAAAAAAGGANKKEKEKEKSSSGSHLAMMGSDDDEPVKTEFERDLEDISVSDVIEKIQENMHHEAYMEHKLKGQIFICFKEDIELKKVSGDN